MSAATEIDASVSAFLTGRLTFDRLVVALRAVADDESLDLVAARLRDFVNVGQLPPDLAPLIMFDLQREMPAAHRPPADVGANSPAQSAPQKPAAKQPSISDVPQVDPLHDKVNDGVLSSLVSDFKGLRAQRRQTKSADDRGLDAVLSDFHSARLRRDAAAAAKTETRRPERPAEPEPEVRSLTVGEMVKGRFVLDRELGRGGMGSVFRAVDRRRLEARHAHPYVALKLLNGDFRRHPEAFRTLEAEARKAQALSHPNIVTVFDFDRDGPHVFLVMELLEGEPLDAVLHAQPEGLGQAAFPIIEGMCAGLAHAHARGVVHSDLKPANIFLCADHTVKVLDFGIASAAQSSGFDAASLGSYTPTYASPEILRSEPRHPRDDVYALGLIAYELYCGTHPFDRKSADKAQQSQMRPERPQGIAKHPWHTIEKALSFDRKRRPADAAAFSEGMRHAGLLSRIWPL